MTTYDSSKSLMVLVFVVFCALLASCREQIIPASITVGTNAVEFSQLMEEGSTQRVTFKANYEWNASSNVDWLSVKPTYGLATETGVVTITLRGLNLEQNGRTGQITLTCQDKTATITVSQMSYFEGKTLQFDCDSLYVANEDSVYVSFTSNVVHSLTFPTGTNYDWITCREIYGESSATKKALLLLAPNPEATPRSAVLCLRQAEGYLTDTIIVTQMAFAQQLVTVSDYGVYNNLEPLLVYRPFHEQWVQITGSTPGFRIQNPEKLQVVQIEGFPDTCQVGDIFPVSVTSYGVSLLTPGILMVMVMRVEAHRLWMKHTTSDIGFLVYK